MKLVLANEATAAQRRVYFDCRDATDGITAETGEATGQPQISTNGGAWTNTGIGTLSAIGNGRYYADLTQAAVLTAGDVIETRYKSAATAETPGDSVHVVAFDPHDAADLGITALTGHTPQTADHTAAIADIPTVAEFNARTLVAASYFDPAADTVANVTTVATLTGHTAQTADHTAAIADIPTVAEFNARTLVAASYFDPAADTVANVTTVATLTGHTAQTADHTAAIADIPTVAEFNARTLVAASYFDPAADTVANVTTVGSVTTKTGYSLVSTGLDLVLADGRTLPNTLEIIAAAVAGRISGAGTGTETFLGMDEATTRVVVTVDGSGNRSNITYS